MLLNNCFLNKQNDKVLLTESISLMTEIGAFHSANPFFLISQVAMGDCQLYFKSLLTTCRKQGQCGDEDPKGSMVGGTQTIPPTFMHTTTPPLHALP